MKRSRLPRVDMPDTLCTVGALLLAVTVYLIWPVWTPAFVGAELIVAGVVMGVSQHGRRN